MPWFWLLNRIRSLGASPVVGHVAGVGCALVVWSCLSGCSPPRGIYHTVQPGQTLYRIGQTYKLDADYLARINGIRDPSRLKAGKRLFIPGARGSKYVPPTVATARRDRVAESKNTSARSPSTANRSKTRKPASSVPSAAKVSSAKKNNVPKTSGIHFIWPVRGKLVKSFGQQGYGGRKGVEIEVRQGQKIVAAAAGRVTYSGNGIKGYGNLIILKHANDYFTVYGFNQKNLVDNGVYVSKGERIALGGSPPGYKGARLHFEIRRGKDAINPARYLP